MRVQSVLYIFLNVLRSTWIFSRTQTLTGNKSGDGGGQFTRPRKSRDKWNEMLVHWPWI